MVLAGLGCGIGGEALISASSQLEEAAVNSEGQIL